MAGKINRPAYEKLIAEDIAWLEKQPRTLERDHILLILRRSPDHEYAEPKTCPACYDNFMRDQLAR